MTFHGKDPEPDKPERIRTFHFKESKHADERTIQAHDVYFYHGRRVGFWNNDGDDRTLVLATEAYEVREEPEATHEQ